LFSSVGLTLMIPLAMLGDMIFYGKRFAPSYLGGTALNVAGFVLINILDQCPRPCRCWPTRSRGAIEAVHEDEIAR